MAKVSLNEISDALEEQDDIRKMAEEEDETIDDYRAKMEWHDYQNKVKAEKELKEQREQESRWDAASMQEDPELWL